MQQEDSHGQGTIITSHFGGGDVGIGRKKCGNDFPNYFKLIQI